MRRNTQSAESHLGLIKKRPTHGWYGEMINTPHRSLSAPNTQRIDEKWLNLILLMKKKKIVSKLEGSGRSLSWLDSAFDSRWKSRNQNQNGGQDVTEMEWLLIFIFFFFPSNYVPQVNRVPLGLLLLLNDFRWGTQRGNRSEISWLLLLGFWGV